MRQHPWPPYKVLGSKDFDPSLKPDFIAPLLTDRLRKRCSYPSKQAFFGSFGAFFRSLLSAREGASRWTSIWKLELASS